MKITSRCHGDEVRGVVLWVLEEARSFMNETTAMRANASLVGDERLTQSSPYRYKRADGSQKGFNTLLVIKGGIKAASPFRCSPQQSVAVASPSPIRADITCGCKHCRSMTRLIVEKSNFVGSVPVRLRRSHRISLDSKLIDHHVTDSLTDIEMSARI